MAAPVKVATQQTTPELSGTFRTPTHTRTHLPEPASGTYTSAHRNSPEPFKTFWNQPVATFRNPPPEPTPAYTGTLRKIILQRNSGTFRNLPPEPTPAYAGTYLRNLSPEPTPAYAGTLRNLPEPASGTYTSAHRSSPEPSGTCLRNLHQHTPEPISGTRLRNLHQHTPELSGTFRNLPPEPAPATRTDTHRSLSGLKTPLAFTVGEKIA